MKKFLLSAIALPFLFSTSLNAQVSFQKKIGISGYPLTITDANLLNDGGYIVCGNDINQGLSPVIIKADASGQVAWVKAIMSTIGNITTSVAVGECVGGGYYFFGIGYDSAFTYNSYYLSKMDVSGNVLWSKGFTFTDNPYSNPKFFQKANGDFVIIPSLWSGTGIITLDANGNYLWGKIFSDDTTKCPGFSGVSCTDGGFIVSGKDGSDVFLVKMDAGGTVQWSSRFQDPNLYSQARTILQTQDGNYLTVGMRANMTAFMYSGFAMKIDASGNTLWHKEYSDASGLYYYFFENAVEMPNGDIALLNSDDYSSISVITKIDQNGNLIYAKQIEQSYPSSQTVNGISKIGNELLISGSTMDNFGYCGFMMKTDATGNNFGCEVSDFSTTVSTLPAMPKFTPTFTTTNIAPPVSITMQTTNLSFSSEDLCLTGVDENTNDELQMTIYPNPAETVANLFINSSVNSENISVRVFDAMGRNMFANTYGGSTKEIKLPLSGFSSGVYMVDVSDGTNSFMRKLVVR